MLPLNPKQIPLLYRRGLAELQAGRAEAALASFEQVLAAQPRLAEAQFQAGRALAALGRRDEAGAALARAQALAPREAAIWTARLDLALDGGDGSAVTRLLREAKAAGLPAAALEALGRRAGGGGALAIRLPAEARAEVDRLGGLMSARRFEEAARLAGQAAARHPRVAVFAQIRGAALAALGQREAALAAFREAVRIDPDHAEAQVALGEALLAAGEAAAARAPLARAVALAPRHAQALGLLGRAEAEAGHPAAGAAHLARARALAPRDARLMHWHGQALHRQGRGTAAVSALEAAAAAGAGGAGFLCDLGQARMQAGQNEAARAAFDAAVAQAPDRAAPLVHRATLLQLLGEFDAAERDLRQAARLEPGNGAFWRIAAVARKLAPGDPLIAEMEALDAGDLSDESRRQLSYALAKAMEDSGAHERVFFYLDRANALTRRRWPYDLRADIAAARRICRSYERRGAAEGHRGPPRPIFVTGLPRSGTTLVEQILASHPEVEGAGETGWLSPHLSRAVEALDAGGGPVDWAEAGRAWAAEAAARFPQAAHVTDKSISTAFYAGFVLAALPEARIVVVRRDPRDTCLSIYRNMFPDGSHRYATDLADLGRYARLSAEMTGFWRARLPAAAFLEVEYEALTAAPEAETRRLLDFCGLSWDPACLDFHANTRRVDTLSLYQVRQPIYRSSVRGWKRYEAELQPLLDALAETGPLL